MATNLQRLIGAHPMKHLRRDKEPHAEQSGVLLPLTHIHDILVDVSRQSVETVHQIDDMVDHLDGIFTLLEDVKTICSVPGSSATSWRPRWCSNPPPARAIRRRSALRSRSWPKPRW